MSNQDALSIITNNIDLAIQVVINVAIAQVIAQFITQIQQIHKIQNSQDFVELFDFVKSKNKTRLTIIKSIENVDFFDFAYKNTNNRFIVNVNRYIFYRDIYVFVNRLKDFVKNFTNKQKIKNLILEYLRNTSLI